MPKYVITRGSYIVDKTVIEAPDEATALLIAKQSQDEDPDTYWKNVGSDDVLFQVEYELTEREGA
jgi:hypothetical protein